MTVTPQIVISQTMPCKYSSHDKLQKQHAQDADTVFERDSSCMHKMQTRFLNVIPRSKNELKLHADAYTWKYQQTPFNEQ